ncbi:hypothetical protein A2765_00270 [Candidatus Kaiserbacteria bacterium RIFCSPHIGHO2_01_FULL_56_24]|uniref:Uncharacterized protein n=1 Tax=Candidatus Kaiserbacteria bacterium RIFCSPHIGHO2_01_FULL_56_24 TaxID=1798487 RepID=A0A1F6DGW2_9BACT|nr:MAG: hypothetical protein A2765_00270 [Candidatus Kaiserbacteria bacterium RIFCSPHIGHO2_01_FULL_56_24]
MKIFFGFAGGVVFFFIGVASLAVSAGFDAPVYTDPTILDYIKVIIPFAACVLCIYFALKELRK